LEGGDYLMKTMTCRQLGGPCDTLIHGATSEEMMNAGAAHISSQNDEGHKQAVSMMEAARTDPAAAKAWGDKFEADFTTTPVDA